EGGAAAVALLLDPAVPFLGLFARHLQAAAQRPPARQRPRGTDGGTEPVPGAVAVGVLGERQPGGRAARERPVAGAPRCGERERRIHGAGAELDVLVREPGAAEREWVALGAPDRQRNAGAGGNRPLRGDARPLERQARVGEVSERL